MSYVDGFVIPIPKKNMKMYKKMAKEGREAWLKFGALDYKECMLEDSKTHPGTLGFSKGLKLKPTETVCFSFIIFKNRKHRDAVNKKVMALFDTQYADAKDMVMPFDAKHMMYGGFETFVE